MEEEYYLKRFLFPFSTKKAIIYIILIAVIVFGNMIFNDFAWDDLSYIIFNPELFEHNFFALFQESFFNHGTQYRAMSAVYFYIVHLFFKENALLYHATQLCIHIINSLLVFYIFNIFFKRLLGFFLTLFFLIHPIQVESVSFIGATVNPLFFLFGIIPIFILIQIQKFSRYQYIAYMIIFLSLLLSLLTKETGIAFIPIILCYTLFFQKKHFKKIGIITFLSFITYLFIRIKIGHIGFQAIDSTDITPIVNLSLEKRLLHIPIIFMYYFKTLIFPHPLAINQKWIIDSLSFQQFYLPLIGVISIIIFLTGIYWKFKKNNLINIFLFFLVWFFSGMMIHLQILPLDMTVADRWFYLPFVGMLGIIGFCIRIFISPQYQKFTFIIMTVIILLLSIKTIIRNSQWKNDITLLQNDTKVYPNYELENNLGSFFSYQGNYKEALIHTQKAVILMENESFLTNLGFIYEQLGDIPNAQKSYKKALTFYSSKQKKDKVLIRTYLRLSGTYLFNNNPQKAEEILEESIKRYPKNGILYSFLSMSYYNNQKYQQALDAAQKAKELYPNKSTIQLYNNIKEKKQFDIRNL